MNNYKITVEYDGSGFYGWQRQKKFRNTIQECIEENLSKLLKVNISVTGAGRTDAGVHAYNQTANFKTDSSIPDSNKFLYSLNSLLPSAITVKSIRKVSNDFHSRYSAKRREYLYKITTREISIGRKYYLKLNYKLDFKVIDEFIKILIGYHSFKSLCRNKEDKHGFFCNLMKLEYRINKSKNTIVFRILSDRYLHSMVRATIGVLIDLGRGKLQLKDTYNKLIKGEKIKTTYLPANALFLNKIYY
ncbi:MAG: tRNA pseudouridine(38-40) synthase TruA [Ignavibacteria bacterium]